MSVASLLNDTCTVSRSTTSTSTTTGGLKETWAKTASGVACTVQFESGPEATQQMRETSIRTASVFMLTGQDVRVTDVLSGFTTAPASGFAFSVIADPIDESGRATYYRVKVETVRDRTSGQR